LKKKIEEERKKRRNRIEIMKKKKSEYIYIYMLIYGRCCDVQIIILLQFLETFFLEMHIEVHASTTSAWNREFNGQFDISEEHFINSLLLLSLCTCNNHPIHKYLLPFILALMHYRLQTYFHFKATSCGFSKVTTNNLNCKVVLKG
jgi:hypothetical protein